MFGKKFNSLTVIARAASNKWGNPRWECLCDCGKITIAKQTDLKNGKHKSCGCIRKHSYSGGRPYCSNPLVGTPTYWSWHAMLQRCSNSNDSAYKNYGGRGISVCERWSKFINFFEDMGHRPDGLTIERIDNNKNYSLENCKWATYKEQARNKRNNLMFQYQGQTKLLVEWAEQFSIKYNTLHKRLQRGHTIETALNV